MNGIGCRPEFHLKGLPPFLGKPVGIGLRGPGHADSARQCPVVPQFHCRRNYRRVVSGEVECAFLVLSCLDDRESMAGSCDYAPIGVYNLGSDKGGAAAALEYVEVDALAAKG